MDAKELVPVFHYSHRKVRSSLPVVALTSKYLVGVPSKAASSERENHGSKPGGARKTSY